MQTAMLLFKTDKKITLQDTTVNLACHDQNNRIQPCFHTYKQILQTPALINCRENKTKQMPVWHCSENNG